MPLATGDWSKDKLKHGLKAGLPTSLEMKLRLVFDEAEALIAEFYKLPAAEPSVSVLSKIWLVSDFLNE